MDKEKAGLKQLGATIKRQREEEVEERRPKRRSKAGTKAQTKHFDMKKREVVKSGGKPGNKARRESKGGKTGADKNGKPSR